MNLCQTIVTTTKNVCPSLENEAAVIQKKFETLLTLFSKCHCKYNSSEAVGDTEIDVLGKNTLTLIFFLCCKYHISQLFNPLF